MNILETFITDRMLSYTTAKNYKTAVNKYETFCGLSLEELIEEADKEEEQGIRWKRRTLKTRLIGFRNLCADTVSKNSVVTYFNCIKAIYRHFEIEIGTIPPLGKQGFSYPQMKYEDLITKKELKKAYDVADEVTKATLLFMATTGVTRYDTCNSVTIQDFIDACADYITTDNLEDQLHELALQDNVVPTFYLRRQKTKKWFYTYCTPECTSTIVRYLIHRVMYIKRNHKYNPERFPQTQLEYTDKLFKLNEQTLGKKFAELNDQLGFGYCGAYRKLRPHMLRKYHASTLLNSKHFTEEEVDAVQGRSKDKLHEAYFKNDPAILRKQYIQCLKELVIVQEAQMKLFLVEQEKMNLEEKIDDQDVLIHEILDVQKEMQRLME